MIQVYLHWHKEKGKVPYHKIVLLGLKQERTSITCKSNKWIKKNEIQIICNMMIKQFAKKYSVFRDLAAFILTPRKEAF